VGKIPLLGGVPTTSAGWFRYYNTTKLKFRQGENVMNNINPFKFSDTNKRYHTFDYFYRNKFGCKCVKIPLDCGFGCPSRCTYCNIKNDREIIPIVDQFEKAKIQYKPKWPGDVKYIAYFQTGTNTYAPVDVLRKLYYEAITLPDVVGVNIATRADILSDEVVELLREIADVTYLTVELGLQTIHDVTAESTNRRHTFSDFLEGFLKLRGINTCVHIINGLPGENKDMMLQTAAAVADLHPACVKIHLLHVLKNTVLETQYFNGEFEVLSLEEYVDIVVAQLEILPPEIYIGRITGDGLESELVAPLWPLKKFVVINEIDKRMVNLDTWQGQSAR